jgi:hypothetical protein
MEPRGRNRWQPVVVRYPDGSLGRVRPARFLLLFPNERSGTAETGALQVSTGNVPVQKLPERNPTQSPAVTQS